MNDLHSLMPHCRKDAKLDTKSKLYQLNELADLYNCNNVFFFEARKGQDLYLWMSKAPNGPTVKMHLQNLHTMEELHFTGNCLKGSRPILSFASTFASQPHLKVMKELFTHIFGVPQGARKSKPFVDHVMNFTVADGKVWVRCYQISETEAGAAPDDENAPTKKLRGGDTNDFWRYDIAGNSWGAMDNTPAAASYGGASTGRNARKGSTVPRQIVIRDSPNSPTGA